MEQILPIEEIRHDFDSEWVLLEDPETGPQNQVLAGKVLAHSKDRDEVYRTAVEVRPKRFAVLYTGTIPEDTAIIL